MSPPRMAAKCVRFSRSSRRIQKLVNSDWRWVGIFLFHPTIPNYPKAKFPGVVVFSEIYQGE